MTQNKKDTGWLLLKRGLYWRPDSMGYTAKKSEAGRYHYDEAKHRINAGVSMVHEDDVPDHLDKCGTVSITFAPICDAPVDGTVVLTDKGCAKFIKKDMGPDDEGWYFCRMDGYVTSDHGNGSNQCCVYPMVFAMVPELLKEN